MSIFNVKYEESSFCPGASLLRAGSDMAVLCPAHLSSHTQEQNKFGIDIGVGA